MYFKINDLVLGSGNGYHLDYPVVGLSKPNIRINTGNYSGRDGGYVSGQFYSPREIVINGFYIGGTCESAETLRSNLIDSLPIRQSLDVFITTFAGKQYYTEAYLADFKMDLIDMKSGRYQIVLVSPDPFLYDAGDGIDPESGYVISTIYKETPGGYVTPYVLPVQWAAGIGSETVTNNGDVEVYPEIILTGQFTNPEILNVTTGKFIKLNMVTTIGDVIMIDIKNREITLNGSSVVGNKTTDSTWWTLALGDNDIVLSTDNGSDASTGIMRWRIAYQGA